jgi:hypothetical protein
MIKSLFSFCMEHNDTTLLEQWDADANGSLTPQNVSFNSHKVISWRCEKGHKWESKVCDRKLGKVGCPYCRGKRPIVGQTDLASNYPSLAEQWHPDLNGDLRPQQVMPRSQKKVWWICDRGHSWDAVIKSRVNGAGCPVCANKKIIPGENDLTSSHPELAAEWHPDKNGEFRPENVVSGTHQSVWWQCENGHSWKASIASRVAGRGCPVCSGKEVVPGFNDLKTAFPDIASQWHNQKNLPLTADMVSPYSNKKMWWICNLGHEYQATVALRTGRSTECPYCTNKKVLLGFNDLATSYPKIANQWHPTLNGDLRPEQVTYGSRKKVWWICEDGHIWRTPVYSRAGKQKTGCPVCAGTVKQKKK